MLAAVLLSVYGLNVLAGKAHAALGWPFPHASDVVEFLLVLAAMIFFVAGLLRSEAAGTPPQAR